MTTGNEGPIGKIADWHQRLINNGWKNGRLNERMAELATEERVNTEWACSSLNFLSPYSLIQVFLEAALPMHFANADCNPACTAQTFLRQSETLCFPTSSLKVVRACGDLYIHYHLFLDFYTVQASVSKSMNLTNSKRHALDVITYQRNSNKIPNNWTDKFGNK